MRLAARSTLDELTSLAGELLAALSAVLDHAEVKVFRNSPGSGMFYVPIHPYTWRPLAREHQSLLGDARRLFDDWSSLAALAVGNAAPSRLEAFEQLNEAMRLIVELSDDSPAPAQTVQLSRARVSSDMQSQLEMLADLPSAHAAGVTLLVPDTNAIVYQPAVDEWNPDLRDWTLVLVPQLIRELDQLKMRGDGVAEAAQSFIRRLKEYGRRGDTFAGVQLRPRARLRVTAIDADMGETLEWLRAGHGDDELLASALELRWQDLNATVVLVTRDLNLQNKARLARMPYIDVEDIAEQRRRPVKPSRGDEQAEAAARARLDGTLPYMREGLGVPPATRTTTLNEQSWTVRAAPLLPGSTFAPQVLGRTAHEWVRERVVELSGRAGPMPQPVPALQTGARGFAVRCESRLPSEEVVTLAADAGGLVGAQHRLGLEPQGRRALSLRSIEDDYLGPLLQACVEALEHLGAAGRTLVDVWIIGIGSFEILTAGHATLRGERDGWLDTTIVHMSDQLELASSGDGVKAVIERWGRELAREAGIPAWEP